MKMHKCLITICLFAFTVPNLATLSPKTGKGKEKKIVQDVVVSGPVNLSVFLRNLVVETPVAKDIFNNYAAYHEEVHKSRFKGLKLGYVTPWNNHGYDVAKIFANKFTHISPVWLGLKRVGMGKFDLSGAHDIDKGWMKDVLKAAGTKKVKIVPRLLLDDFRVQDYQELFNNDRVLSALISFLVEACKKWNFDGFVLEERYPQPSPEFYDTYADFIKTVASSMSRENLQLILVVAPKREHVILFTSKHYEELYDYVAGFSLMTYDFSNVQRPGPNAPINWVEDCVRFLAPDPGKRDKILTGLNFFGNAYTANGGGPIVAHEYLKLLKLHNKKLQYNSEFAENYFEAKVGTGRHLVFYPTLYSIQKRLDLFRKLGTGISLWELGQGLDYFYDLL